MTITRRTVLKGTAAGVVAPVLLRAAPAFADTPVTAQWISFGPHSANTMRVNWSSGTASNASVPTAPAVQWGTTASYGSVKPADTSRCVPRPGAKAPADATYYNSALLSSLEPATTYHYSVSNDGSTWSPDATFTTAPRGPSRFRFTAFGDQSANAASAGQMVSLAAAHRPTLHVLPGDLAYATKKGAHYPDVSGFAPSQWDNYLSLVSRRGAASIPWQPSVGAHEVEPVGTHGYDGFLTRFPQGYAHHDGAPASYSYTVGNVGFIHLDGNEVSAQETVNTGYSKGRQTQWLASRLERYRSRAVLDFIVVVVNCCCYSSNQQHGSDGGLRSTWGPLFDKYAVDLVISGHVHAYERTHPMRSGKRSRQVPSGGTVHPASDGTTYICAGGGGNGLYSTWYGSSGGGDAGSSTAPKLWRWNGDKTEHVTDSVADYSAYRRAAFSCLVVDVRPPKGPGTTTTMKIRAVAPEQSGRSVTSISNTTTFDSVTLARTH